MIDGARIAYDSWNPSSALTCQGRATAQRSSIKNRSLESEMAILRFPKRHLTSGASAINFRFMAQLSRDFAKRALDPKTNNDV